MRAITTEQQTIESRIDAINKDFDYGDIKES
jgi:hypothetical protein